MGRAARAASNRPAPAASPKNLENSTGEMVMKYRSSFWLMSALVAMLAGAHQEARAQERGRIRINTIRVGFPSSLVDSQFKAGNWSPVYVDVTAGSGPI